MPPTQPSPETIRNEQQELIAGMVVLLIAMAFVVTFYVLLRMRGHATGCCTPVYAWQDLYDEEEEDERFGGSVRSNRSYDTFTRNNYKIEPKIVYVRSDAYEVALSSETDAEAKLQRDRLKRSMQLAASMIQAMQLQAVPWGDNFSRSTLFRATLWQDVERRTYFFQVFDLIAYDPELFSKLGSEDWLEDNPEPLLLVADTLWDQTQNLEEAEQTVIDLKLRFEAGLKLELMNPEKLSSF